MSGRVERYRLRRSPAALALAVCAVCVGLATLTLLVPSAPTLDPWGWILWGREVANLDFSTRLEGSPSWKPLPVLATAPLSVAGDAAPTLWVVLARAAGLLGLVFAFRVASRLTGDRGIVVRSGAGLVAAVGTVLSAEWVRAFSHAYTEPLSVGLVLAAIDRHLAGRPRQALVVGALLSCSRPEAFPLVVLYGAVIWRRSEASLALVASTLAAVAALWLIPDWIGSGDPFYGGKLADELLAREGLPELMQAAYYTPLALSVAAIAGAALAIWQRDWTFAGIVGLAAAWFLLLRLAMYAGYPAHPRYFVLPAAIVCVAGAAGAARLVEAPPRPWLRAALGVAALILLVASSFVPRTENAVASAKEAVARARTQAELWRAVSAAGGADLRRCGTPRLPGMRWSKGAVAWRLGVPLREVRNFRTSDGEDTLQRLKLGAEQRRSAGTLTVRVRARNPAVLFLPFAGMRIRFEARRGRLPPERLGSSGIWTVYATSPARCNRALRREPPLARVR